MQEPSERAFGRSGFLARVAPFGLGAIVGLTVIAFQALREGHLYQILLGGAGTLALAAVSAAVPWERLPSALETVVPFGYIALVFALRMGTHGPKTPFGLLLLLPSFWLALYGTRPQLAVGLTFSTAALFVPDLIGVSGRVSHVDVEQGLLMIVLFVPVCLTTQSLVARIRRQRGEIETLSLTDPLTGVANRRFLEVELPRELGRSARSGVPLSLAMLDFDHFKRFNDAHGHQAGDRLLAGATAAWQEHLRDADLLARVGGEEFVVVLPECGIRLAVQIVDRLRAATPFGQTCSAGVVLWDGSEHVGDLIGRADAALYRAKEQGRDRTVALERIS